MIFNVWEIINPLFFSSMRGHDGRNAITGEETGVSVEETGVSGEKTPISFQVTDRASKQNNKFMLRLKLRESERGFSGQVGKKANFEGLKTQGKWPLFVWV